MSDRDNENTVPSNVIALKSAWKYLKTDMFDVFQSGVLV